MAKGIRSDGRPARSYPLQAPTSVMVKLGSIAAHAEEAAGPGGHPFDALAIRSLLDDPEVREWMAAMRKLAFLPEPR